MNSRYSSLPCSMMCSSAMNASLPHSSSRTSDHLFGPGAALKLKDELELGRGRFRDELTTEEVGELNQELEERLSSVE